jgi:AcrR family transcriptional regulator
MADDHSLPSEGARDRKKDEVRNRLLDAWIDLMVEGSVDLTHDEAAARAGVARRTAYRYFPDRKAMMEAALLRVRELAGPHVVLPRPWAISRRPSSRSTPASTASPPSSS